MLHQTKNILEKLSSEAQAEMEKIHFTADLHHMHDKIIDICSRPTTIQDHTDWLVKEVINKWVGKKDTLYLLGDVSFAKRPIAEKFIDRLNGNKFLILGNHDKNIYNSTRFSQITQIKDFSFSQFGLNIHIVCCHYPMVSWNRKPHGSFHLFGHVHGRYSNPSELMLDVGIDNRGDLHTITGGVHRPINLYEVVVYMENKKKYIESLPEDSRFTIR